MQGGGIVFMDLQFDKAKFFELFGDQVQQALPLVTDEFTFENKQLIIDHLDVTGVESTDSPAASVTLQGPSTPFTVSTTAVRVQVSLDAALTTRDNVLNAGQLGVPKMEFDAFELVVDVDLGASAVNGSIVLRATPVGFDAKYLKVLSEEQKQSVLDKLPVFDRKIDLPDVAGTALTATNAGLALHPSGVVALLVELTPPDRGVGLPLAELLRW